jgi:hypothetical protein
MTCDPVVGYVEVHCIERCAFGAVKAWIAFMIATNEIASHHRATRHDELTQVETAAAPIISRLVPSPSPCYFLPVALLRRNRPLLFFSRNFARNPYGIGIC